MMRTLSIKFSPATPSRLGSYSIFQRQRYACIVKRRRLCSENRICPTKFNVRCYSRNTDEETESDLDLGLFYLPIGVILLLGAQLVGGSLVTTGALIGIVTLFLVLTGKMDELAWYLGVPPASATAGFLGFSVISTLVFSLLVPVIKIGLFLLAGIFCFTAVSSLTNRGSEDLDIDAKNAIVDIEAISIDSDAE
eukprot:jgi/Picsp_1/1719/NSC_05192-R1_---NA---